jgi:hypothetical protein
MSENACQGPCSFIWHPHREAPRLRSSRPLKGYGEATLAHKQNFPRKTGTDAIKDHKITTRRADAAEPSRCR